MFNKVTVRLVWYASSCIGEIYLTTYAFDIYLIRAYLEGTHSHHEMQCKCIKYYFQRTFTFKRNNKYKAFRVSSSASTHLLNSSVILNEKSLQKCGGEYFERICSSKNTLLSNTNQIFGHNYDNLVIHKKCFRKHNQYEI